MLSEIVRLLLKMIPDQRAVLLREESAPYGVPENVGPEGVSVMADVPLP
jgi:hypothetical protein